MAFFPELKGLKSLSHHLQELIRSKLWAKVLKGMFAGILTGSLLGPSVGWVPPDIANTLTHWLAFPGDLFLGLIKMIIIPLVVASIVIGLPRAAT